MSKLELKGVSKRFKDVTALENVDVTFEENKIYGLLGRNGAGKSTMLNIISNRLFQDEGKVLMDGVPVTENDEAQKKIFLISEKMLYPEKMKVKDAFKWTKEFYPDFDMEMARRLADEFGLQEKKKMDGLSTGYETIFKVILALSVNVPFVFFDEPVLGLDANHRELFYRRLLEKYSEEPFTAVISTHLIEEVSNVIEEIIIIKKGRIIHSESREELRRKGYTVSGSAARVDSYIRDKNVIGTDALGGLKTAYLLGSPDRTALPEGLEISGMDLQKLFIQLTNE